MRMIMLVALVSGCESMDATGNPTQPVAPPVAEPAPASVPSEEAPVAKPVEPASADGFDFDADAQREDPDGEAPVDPIALLALQQGVVLEDAPTPEPAAAADPIEAPAAPASGDAEPVYAWDPDTAGPSTWGVRLLSTMNSTLPPRAVIGLPDGSEQVVQPGTMLAEHGLIIMAVGQNIIEVAQVVPDGVQARVETRTVSALFAQ